MRFQVYPGVSFISLNDRAPTVALMDDPPERLLGATGLAPTWSDTTASAWRELAGDVVGVAEFARYVDVNWAYFAWPHARCRGKRLEKVLRAVMKEGGWVEEGAGWRMIGKKTRGKKRARRKKKGREDADRKKGRTGRLDRAAKSACIDMREASNSEGEEDEESSSEDLMEEKEEAVLVDVDFSVIADEAEIERIMRLVETSNGADPNSDGADPKADKTAVPLRIPRHWIQPTPHVALSSFDRNASLAVEPSSVGTWTVRGRKGWRSVRATHGAVRGDWFYEVVVGAGRGNVRLGWATRRQSVGAPVGFADRSFGIRDRTGEIMAGALPYTYGEPFGPGDVVGCRLRLGEEAGSSVRRGILVADLRWLEFRFMYGCEGPAPLDCLDLFAGGTIEWFLNGASMGEAELFEEKGGIPAGRYYPVVSLFKGADVDVNFGPEFKYAPPKGCLPLSRCRGGSNPEAGG